MAESGDVVYDLGTLSPNEEFTLQGTKDDGKFDKNELEIFVNGDKEAEFHVSCSQPIGPGTTQGEFVVVAATSKKNGPICEPPEGGECGECKGGVVDLTMQYAGPAAATVVMESGDAIYNLGVLSPGEEFSISGTEDDGKFDKNELDVFVDGDEHTSIHVSCSQPIGPGTVHGDFIVVDAASKKNGPICEPPEGGECGECKGGVVDLTMQYNGPAAAAVVMESGDAVYDLGVLTPGEEFSISGTEDDGKFDKNELDVFVDGDEHVSIHVSCSQPIGPGTVHGDFTVVAATSKKNGDICSLPDCVECGTGADNAHGLSTLSLVYSGLGASIEIRNGKKDKDLLLFSGSVSDGDLVELAAADVNEDKFKADMNFYDASDDDEEILALHTSCSKPIEVGDVHDTSVGSFEIVAASDKDEMPLCGEECVKCGWVR